MIFVRLGLTCACLSLSGPVVALDLNLTGDAELVRELDRGADTYFLPTGPFSDGEVPSREVEGRVLRQAWQITGDGISTLDLLKQIRSQMQGQGYTLLLDCTGQECGGFDFRFGIDVLPAPDMFVDLFDFRFVSAQNADLPGAQFVTALVSRAGQVGYIQLVFADPDQASVPAAPAPPPDDGAEPDDVVLTALPEEPSEDTVTATLTSQGHVILSDLVFATGSSTLEEGSYASLTELASFLNADPNRRVVLVGHTDAVGALDGNVTLSRARAASVSQRLIDGYNVSSAQLASEGMGYLAPVASNATEEGRRANRRVEAVLLNTR